MKIEKAWNPELWKPVGVREVEFKEYPCAHNGKLHSFLDYQAPEDRYEVRGIMPKAPNYPEMSTEPKQLLKKL